MPPLLGRSRRHALVGLAALAGLPVAAPPAHAAPQLRAPMLSRPDLRPPLIRVMRHYPGTAPGFILLTPRPAAPSQRLGPYIADDTGRGRFLEVLPKGQTSVGLEVQRYRGRPVLTWSQRPAITSEDIYGGDPRRMYDVIMDDHYRVLRKLQAKGPGIHTDLHDFVITPQDTALVMGFRFIHRDLRAFGRSAHAVVVDGVVQEISLATGKVLLDWHAIDHVPLRDSVVPVTPGHAWDPYHLNSVSLDSDGQLLISARHTSTVYKVSRRRGWVLWRLGGKRSSFAMGPRTRFYYQHDAELNGNGLLSVFDNGSAGFASPHKQSRVVYLRLDRRRRVATEAQSLYHPAHVHADSQGNGQRLPGGDTFVGWGSSPRFSEFSPGGRLLFDAQVPTGRYQSYRVFRQKWTGVPPRPPAVAARASGSNLSVYASWNGSTEVTAWRVLAGSSPNTLAPVVTRPWNGLETRIPATSNAPYVAVQAYDPAGHILATSKVIPVQR